MHESLCAGGGLLRLLFEEIDDEQDGDAESVVEDEERSWPSLATLFTVFCATVGTAVIAITDSPISARVVGIVCMV